MAEVTSQTDSTVIILNSSEARQLETVLSDWIVDSYSRAVECGDTKVLETYQATIAVLKELFDACHPGILAGVDA